MAYQLKIKQSKEKVYNHAIATKIIDLMDKLRLDQNETSSRRWIWELLQNAKDVAYDNSNVSIEIEFQPSETNGFLEFKHNGKPFTTDNLTFLIEQVSTKERKPQDDKRVKTTGKFGTGFLTTHLLSEKVAVEGVIKEPDEPYKKFDLLLDRSGRQISEIIKSVNNSLASIEDIDTQEPYEKYDATEFNTKFRYKLDTNGIVVAKNGLKDLHKSLIFTLVFLPEIKSVNLTNDGICYELSKEIELINEHMKIYTVQQKTISGISESKIVLLTKNDASIAVEIEYNGEQIIFKNIDEHTPRIFCDFPLIGTEVFPFPVIVNSSLFNPNEPRDGIYLTDRSDMKIDENKSIMNDAVELYCILLNYASENNWGNIFNLAKFPKFKEKDWLSEKWYNEAVLNIIKKVLSKTPIVDTENHGRIAILNESGEANVWFPASSKKEVRSKIWDLMNLRIPQFLPRRADIDSWYDILWEDCSRLTLQAITRDIQHKGNMNSLEEALVKPTNPVFWLNSYFALLTNDEETLNDIINDKYIVIPNQNAEFKKKSHLKTDVEIEEELKNVMSILGVDSRDYLRHKEIITGEIVYDIKKQTDIIDEINKVLKDGKNENNIQACNYIITLFAEVDHFPEKRKMIFEFCENVNIIEGSQKRKISEWSEEIWQEVDKKVIRRITQVISDCTNIRTLSELIKKDFDQTIKWLDSFITFLNDSGYDYLLDSKKTTIFPNQKGDLLIKESLFLDGEIDDDLKDISAALGYDFREELLDSNIYLELSDNRTKTQINIAQEIIQAITLKFAEFPRSEETKRNFRKLYMWFNKNKSEAEKLFGDLYTNKHKLYDDNEIAENMQKAEELSELMNEFEITNIDELRRVLQAKRTADLYEQREEISKETLVSLGITSIEELEEALKDVDIASRFVHSSSPTVEMFKHAQGLINRAKTNVIEHLKGHPEYDCSELEELSPTVIGGIKKEGLVIHVVVRPSDNGEVIVYYASEKDTLDYANAELWIDNGKETPIHLTLGKILKKTGINRIPV